MITIYFNYSNGNAHFVDKLVMTRQEADSWTEGIKLVFGQVAVRKEGDTYLIIVSD